MDYYQKYIKYKSKYLKLKQQNGGREDKKIDFRYIIFSNGYYYPIGGWEDFFDTADTLDEAKRIYEEALKVNDWAHVVDITNKKIIYNSWVKDMNNKIDIPSDLIKKR